MPFNATTVQMPDLNLVVVRAKHDKEPDIKAAWQTLESRLSSLKGRKFYGICCKEESEFAYYAGLEPLDQTEIEWLGFQTLTVKGGKYARVRLSDWRNHTDQIGPIFEELHKTFATNPNRPVVEHYRSQSDLDLLAPLAE